MLNVYAMATGSVLPDQPWPLVEVSLQLLPLLTVALQGSLCSLSELVLAIHSCIWLLRRDHVTMRNVG